MNFGFVALMVGAHFHFFSPAECPGCSCEGDAVAAFQEPRERTALRKDAAARLLLAQLSSTVVSLCAEQCLSRADCGGFFHSRKLGFCQLVRAPTEDDVEAASGIEFELYLLDGLASPCERDNGGCGDPASSEPVDRPKHEIRIHVTADSQIEGEPSRRDDGRDDNSDGLGAGAIVMIVCALTICIALCIAAVLWRSQKRAAEARAAEARPGHQGPEAPAVPAEPAPPAYSGEVHSPEYGLPEIRPRLSTTSTSYAGAATGGLDKAGYEPPADIRSQQPPAYRPMAAENGMHTNGNPTLSSSASVIPAARPPVAQAVTTEDDATDGRETSV